MTPDQIEEAAIEAAMREFSIGILIAMGESRDAAEKKYAEKLEDRLEKEDFKTLRAVSRAAIDAYDAAMWIEGEPPDREDGNWICEPSVRRCERFRPLPKPPEKP